MNNERASKTSKIEISDSDLINESVANAIERRNSNFDSKKSLSKLSDDKAESTTEEMAIEYMTLGYDPENM